MTTRNAESMGSYGAEWTSHGYSGCGNVSSLIDSLKGRSAVVCGNAEGVFDELAKALEFLGPDTVVFGVNDVGMYLPKMDHWVSLHADNLGIWKAVRWMHSRDQEFARYHSVDKRPVVEFVWDRLTPCFALSGYFAMQLAYIMGAELIVLTGCPGSPKRRFFEYKARDTFGYGRGDQNADEGIFQQVTREMKRLPEFKERVRSTSGWTQQFFGGI